MSIYSTDPRPNRDRVINEDGVKIGDIGLPDGASEIFIEGIPQYHYGRNSIIFNIRPFPSDIYIYELDVETGNIDRRDTTIVGAPPTFIVQYASVIAIDTRESDPNEDIWMLYRVDEDANAKTYTVRRGSLNDNPISFEVIAPGPPGLQDLAFDNWLGLQNGRGEHFYYSWGTEIVGFNTESLDAEDAFKYASGAWMDYEHDNEEVYMWFASMTPNGGARLHSMRVYPGDGDDPTRPYLSCYLDYRLDLGDDERIRGAIILPGPDAADLGWPPLTPFMIAVVEVSIAAFLVAIMFMTVLISHNKICATSPKAGYFAAPGAKGPGYKDYYPEQPDDAGNQEQTKTAAGFGTRSKLTEFPSSALPASARENPEDNVLVPDSDGNLYRPPPDDEVAPPPAAAAAAPGGGRGGGGSKRRGRGGAGGSHGSRGSGRRAPGGGGSAGSKGSRGSRGGRRGGRGRGRGGSHHG